MNGTLRQKYRKYVESSLKHGYASVTDRFSRSPTFRRQMEEQGWTRRTIMEFDWGAVAPPDTGYRTGKQIQATTQRVYRGKEFAGKDEKWDKAQKWSISEWSEARNWKRAKQGWGPTPSQPSSSSRKP